MAFFTTSAAFTALIGNLVFGEHLIGLFFGDELKGAAPLLSILLISVIMEAVFGPVDEILKMGGFQRVVGKIYFAGIIAFVLLSIVLVSLGTYWLAWLQVAYVSAIFVAMNVVLYRHYGFLLHPRWPSVEMLKQLRKL